MRQATAYDSGPYARAERRSQADELDRTGARARGLGGRHGDEEAIRNGYYVVEEGDNFTTIAERTCIPEDQLQELNPNLDPFGLQVQNCVDLVPDGCKKLVESG
jgi:hypothetical protein